MAEPADDAAGPALKDPGGMAWRMLAIAFLAQNAALGINFGTYGTLVGIVEERFETNRALAASGLAVMTLAMGLLSPFVGKLVERGSIRTAMMAGAALNALGYGLLTVAPSIYAVLAIYALVIGPGVCLLGVIPSSTLVSNWFASGRGRALGIVNMPVFTSIFPLVTAMLLPKAGLTGVFAIVALLFLALLPVLALAVPDPRRVGRRPWGDAVAAREDAAPEGPALGGRQILASRSFRTIWIGIGFMTAGGVMLATHLVPIGMSKGLSVQAASTLLFAFGLAASFGALLFGWIADRIGGPRAVVLQALLWVAAWAALIFAGRSLPVLLAAAAAIGLMSGGINVLLGVVAGTWFGARNLGRVLGYVYLYKIPFMFGAAPLAGLLYDFTKSYTLPLTFHIATFLVVALLFILHRPVPPQNSTSVSAAFSG